MLGLEYDTPGDWASHALADPAALLLDHLFCERKAAAMALSLLATPVGDRPGVGALLRALANEEIEHAERVERLLAERTAPRQARGGNPYAQGLRRAIHAGGHDRSLDLLIVSSLIEARSAERFQLLASELRGSTLGGFYEDLWASEVGHYRLFVELAVGAFGESTALARLAELRRCEAALVRGLLPGPRIHSGPPAGHESPRRGGRVP